MKIKNKIESYKAICDLHLNKLPEQVFEVGQEDKVLQFLQKFPAEYYAIRDKSKPSGVFKLSVKRDDVLSEIKEYKLFSINVSSYNYIDCQVLVGEILVGEREIFAMLSKNPHYSVRDAIRNPDYNFKTTIFDNKLNAIPHFDDIYGYIASHNLLNIVVEFAYFNRPIGIYNENIVIYELRTEY